MQGKWYKQGKYVMESGFRNSSFSLPLYPNIINFLFFKSILLFLNVGGGRDPVTVVTSGYKLLGI